MAKTPKLKKSTPSLHSRASKRAPSPPPSSLQTTTTTSTSKPRLSRSSALSLSTHHGAGITKAHRKGPRKTLMSRQQRLRQERGMEKAATVRDIRARKVERSHGRGRLGRERGVKWEELNTKISTPRNKAKTEAKAKGVEDLDDGLGGDLEPGVEEDGNGESGLVVEEDENGEGELVVEENGNRERGLGVEEHGEHVLEVDPEPPEDDLIL